MIVHAGNIRFDWLDYDEEGDVLYLSVGEPRAGDQSDATPEGHAVRYEREGAVRGVTVVNARWLLEHNGELSITLLATLGGEVLRLNLRELRPALVSAA